MSNNCETGWRALFELFRKNGMDNLVYGHV